MANQVFVVSYGAGNIGSVLNMIRKVGGKAMLSEKPQQIREATKLLLPGVGSFDSAVVKLQNLGLYDPLIRKAEEGVPILGICLGMQLLAQSSEEGKLKGLGLIGGKVSRFSISGQKDSVRIPHMGWNQISIQKEHPLTRGLDNNSRFYFVHSYHYECLNPADILFQTTHGYNFVSGIQHKNVMGVQFHPEKSHRYGMQLLRNFVELPEC